MFCNLYIVCLLMYIYLPPQYKSRFNVSDNEKNKKKMRITLPRLAGLIGFFFFFNVGLEILKEP